DPDLEGLVHGFRHCAHRVAIPSDADVNPPRRVGAIASFGGHELLPGPDSALVNRTDARRQGLSAHQRIGSNPLRGKCFTAPDGDMSLRGSSAETPPTAPRRPLR